MSVHLYKRENWGAPRSAFCANGRDRHETRFHQLNLNGRNLIFNGSDMSQLFPYIPQFSFNLYADMTIPDIRSDISI